MIGILALQGDYPSHEKSLHALGRETRRITRPQHLEGLDALVLPGGESTTMLKLLGQTELEDPLRALIQSGIPVLATCAGLILLSREVHGPEQASLGLVDCSVQRNGYGRQLHSGIKHLRGAEGFPDCDGIFIRAPRILSTGPEASVLARWQEDPVLLEQGSILGASFHPELSDELHPLTELFVSKL